MFTTRIVPLWENFRANREGNVALMFGLAIVPIMLFAGAAIDLSRLTTERTRLQAALDAAALSVTNADKGTPTSELQKRAEAFFAASYGTGAFGSKPKILVTKKNSIITVQGSSDVDMSIMQLAGYNKLTVSASTGVTAERKKLELALVLDNTGSMGQAGKMPALKAAVNELIDALKQKVVNPDDVKMSIVPFNTEVRIDTGYFNASWLRWDVVLENTALSLTQRQPPDPTTWTGCLADRDTPYDASSEPAGVFSSRYVAAQCHASSLAQTEPLTTDLELIRLRAQSMTPNGYTNVTIGLTTGLATLRKDSPFGSASSNESNIEKFMIVLTDGDNTRNRWDASSGPIDDRLKAACQKAKNDPVDKNVKIFTIRVIDGNANLLKQCASDPSMYYDVKNASELQPVFRKILDAIQGVRITS